MKEGSQKASMPSWQSTLIALALILLVGGIFIAVYEKSGIEDAVKAWAAIGTLVGVIVGAVPAYFFGQQGATAAREEAQRTHESAIAEAGRLQSTLERANDATKDAHVAREQASLAAAEEQGRAAAAHQQAAETEERVQTLISLAEPDLLKQARKTRADLTW